MKRIVLLFVFLLPVAFQALAKDDLTSIVLENKGGSHSEYYPPADMPEVYYDSDNLEIIVVGDGFADYYDVNIISQSTLLAVISTQIDGYGDTIDVSSLPDGNYTILITSSNNNQFEGEFTNY